MCISNRTVGYVSIQLFYYVNNQAVFCCFVFGNVIVNVGYAP